MPITSQYSPSLFTLVPTSELSLRHFEFHPIWSEYYDYEERREIAAWGVDPEWLASELERVHEGSDHCAYPILRPYPLPDRMRLYLRALVTANDGRQFHGYVMNEEADVLSLFANDDQFCFSRGEVLKELNQTELERLAAAIGSSPTDLFPVSYRTEFLDSNDKLIAGVFSLTDDIRARMVPPGFPAE